MLGCNDASDGSDGWNINLVTCSACGQDGHEDANCPNKHFEEGSGNVDDEKCFNCGEIGHRVADCPTPRDMNCRYCKQPDHLIKDCPDKPPMVCNNCGEEGHLRKHCENARKINRDHVADVSPEESLSKLKTAASERDVDDAKEAVQEYVKAVGGDITYRGLQTTMIDNNIPIWLVATERQLVSVFTNMDLQGNIGKKYTISYRFSEKPERPREAEQWPSDREELLNRLDDAGEVVDSGLRKCHNCGELGHSSKSCTQEKEEKQERAKPTCNNCGSEEHRLRDCPEPRVDRFACKNCGQSGHKAAECEEPPNMDLVECRKCSQKGHFAKDCDQPPNLDNVTCRNCEKTGHFSRDCPEPKDWSKVQCSNCEQYGHTKVKCQQPPKASEDFPPAEDRGAANMSEDSAWPSGDANAAPVAVAAGDGW